MYYKLLNKYGYKVKAKDNKKSEMTEITKTVKVSNTVLNNKNKFIVPDKQMYAVNFKGSNKCLLYYYH